MPPAAQPPSPNVLIVDDTPENLQLLVRMLKEHGYKARPVSSGPLALDAARQSPPDLVLLDINMPEMNGYEVCAELKKDPQLREIPVIFISAMHESLDKIKAFGAGGVDYVTKPFQAEEVEARVKTHLELFRQKRAERELLEKTLNGSIKLLTDIQASADPPSFRRAQRLRDLVMAYVKHARLEPAWEYELAAVLSPIGLVTVPPRVINRFRQGLGLSSQESAMLERTPEMGYQLLSNIPRLESVARMVLYQAKPFDGQGLPDDGVATEGIPLGGRLLKILADLVAGEERHLSLSSALNRMRQAVGHYDPLLLESVASLFSQDGLPLNLQDPAQVMEVSLKQLQPGDVLAVDIVFRNGTVVLPAKTVLSNVLIMKLSNFADLETIRPVVKIKTRT